MAEEEIKILAEVPFEWLDAEGKPLSSTFVTYQDKAGRVGSIVIRKKEPTKDEILTAIKERRS